MNIPKKMKYYTKHYRTPACYSSTTDRTQPSTPIPAQPRAPQKLQEREKNKPRESVTDVGKYD